MKNNTRVIQESSGGLLLLSAALFAIILANSPWRSFYDNLLNTPITILQQPLLLWINDGLMTIFFLLVGLEIKREFLIGKLQDPRVAMLPIVGALGGVIVPGLIYVGLNYSNPSALHGWGIPVATDIAFSLAVLSLLGSRIPVSLKIFLTALAIIDDIAAVIIIALFYTDHLSSLAFAIAALIILLLILMNQFGIITIFAYLFVGFFLWLAVLKSGIHATLSGIVLAFTIPLHSLERLEKNLVPWVALFVLPIFAFANSGFSLSGINRDILFHTATLGIILGLVIGKQVGIFSSCYVLVKSGCAKLPEAVTWRLFYGMSILCGIGFTMSLFIGSLAFHEQPAIYSLIVRFSVIIGSTVSALIGVTVLLFSLKENHDINDR